MDTLKAARALEAGGLNRKQAERIAKVMHGTGRADLVTEPVLKATLWQPTVAIILANAAIMALLLQLMG